jgi:hypothetical protein
MIRVRPGRECRVCGEDRLVMMIKNVTMKDGHRRLCRACRPLVWKSTYQPTDLPRGPRPKVRAPKAPVIVSWSGVQASSSRDLAVSWRVKLGRECRHCGEDRQVMMSRHPASPDGHATVCKSCASFENKRRYARDRAKGAWVHVLVKRDGESAICRKCGPVRVNWQRKKSGMRARCPIGARESRGQVDTLPGATGEDVVAS